ncbi:hypothetical protein [uncultured Microbacterium sp.]|uniref:hypothetical protein n=1 Tax=uncultured Microbacterium sp. TaxID=191216 RepID=UPI0025E69C1A|nr:hypothetical protein [uncultured Microbacterium sp.]
MATRFGDLPLVDPERNMLDRPGNLSDYLALPQVADLHWPADVVEQWLFDHAGNAAFIEDYGHLDLAAIEWTRELVPAAQLVDIPTGASDAEFLESVARLHRHYLGLRSQGIRDAWERRGTWLVPPILLSRQVLGNEERGLQVVEGRMRVGILQGRAAEALNVVSALEAWVGRHR